MPASINSPKYGKQLSHRNLIDNALKSLTNLIRPVLKPGMDQKLNYLLHDIKTSFLSLEEKGNQFMLSEQRHEADITTLTVRKLQLKQLCTN